MARQQHSRVDSFLGPQKNLFHTSLLTSGGCSRSLVFLHFQIHHSNLFICCHTASCYVAVCLPGILFFVCVCVFSILLMRVSFIFDLELTQITQHDHYFSRPLTTFSKTLFPYKETFTVQKIERLISFWGPLHSAD